MAEITVSGHDMRGQEHWPEPLYPRTSLPGGLGAPITPASLAAACDDALEAASVPSGVSWTLERLSYFADPRRRPTPVIPVLDRWRIGAPVQLWVASGPCRTYPAAYLAEFTFLEDESRAIREAKSRPAKASGLRGLWASWFPSRKDPEIRPQDQGFKRRPPGYFKIPDGSKFYAEPTPHPPDDTTRPTIT
jgi:hypothetical protein